MPTSVVHIPPLRSGPILYAPERIWAARERYFENGQLPSDLLAGSVIQSWERCRQSGRGPEEHVEFDPVERGQLSGLLEAERDWLQWAQPELEQLAKVIADAGYVAMLTNAQGSVLAVAGAFDKRSNPLRWAFRPGVDVSERSIGTSAMGVALAEGKPVSVQGGEHFFAHNQLFHCFAVPIFDPRGQLLGSLDVTRDAPGFAPAVRVLTRQCGSRIERRLFEALPVSWRVAFEAGDDARVAFGQDGQLLAASSHARKLLDLPQVPAACAFEDVFEGRFEHWASRWNSGTSRSLPIALRGGVRLAVQQVESTHSAGWRRGALTRHQGATDLDGPSLPRDPRFRDQLVRAVKAFNADLPILLTGETGAGKEVTAHLLHALSDRAGTPLVALNCGALPADLIASELFGHVEGAYTGAARGGSVGKIEAAQGGTVLLDEIGDMPLPLQVALLRVLDTGEVWPVGAVKARKVDVRFLCATHRDLEAMVRDGCFRADLYYRVSGLRVEVPPLRQRTDFEEVLARLCAQLGQDVARIVPEARTFLARLPWPGNVRQLRHVLKLAFAVAEPNLSLTWADFEGALGVRPPLATPPSVPLRAEDDPLTKALQRCHGNVEAAAASLGISRATFYRRKKALGG